MRKRPLFLGACVFLTGIVFGRYKAMECIVFLVYVLVLEVFYGYKSKMYKKMAGRSVILLSAFFIGVFHMYTQESFRERYLSKMCDGEDVILWGEIFNIETTDYGIRLFLSDCYIHLEDDTIPCNKVIVYTSSSDYQVGQIQKISGKVNMFKEAGNEGSFDSRSYYHSQKYDFAIDATHTQLLGYHKNWVRHAALEVKERFKKVYAYSFPDRTAAFFSGMILGDSTAIPANMKDVFTDGGIVHILAVSGLHMSIIGRGFYQFLRKRGLSFACAGIFGTAVLLFYCLMVGSEMSAIRAVGMMLLSFMASWWGRSYDMLNALGGVAIVLLLDNPFLVEYSGFWFSVSALIGIGFVSDLFVWHTKITSGIWASIAISLCSLPVTALCYYEIPVYASILNAIVLPVLPIAFLLALIGGGVGMFLPWLGRLFLFPCHLFFVGLDWSCQFVSKLPGAMMITGKPDNLIIIVYYGILLVGVLALRWIRDRRRLVDGKDIKVPCWWSAAKGFIVVSCVFTLLFPQNHETEISFLDVGQGSGIYLCMPDQTQIFIDGGSSDVPNVGEYRILPFLKSKQVRKIDYWFVSHADIDHVSGLLEVLDAGYQVECLVLAKAAPMDEAMEEVLRKAKETGAEVIYMEKGNQIVSNTWNVKCLHPKSDADLGKNELSLVLLFEMMHEERTVSALFAGDISAEEERELLKENILKTVDIYSVSHHGSKYSNSEAFLEVIHPQIVIISCAKNNRYGHPHEETLKRLEEIECEVWNTAKGGQIKLKFKKGMIYSSAFRK